MGLSRSHRQETTSNCLREAEQYVRIHSLASFGAAKTIEVRLFQLQVQASRDRASFPGALLESCCLACEQTWAGLLEGLLEDEQRQEAEIRYPG